MVTEPEASRDTGTSGAARPARRGVRKSGRTEVVVAATPDQVMAVVADVTRVGEWSHECQGAAWLDGATRAVPGAQFRGRNRSGLVRWGRRCEIVEAGPRKLVWRTVPTWVYPDSVEWAIRVREAEGGTTIEQTYRVLRIPALHDWVYGVVIPAHKDRSDALVEDLHRLGELAARTDARRP